MQVNPVLVPVGMLSVFTGVKCGAFTRNTWSAMVPASCKNARESAIYLLIALLNLI